MHYHQLINERFPIRRTEEQKQAFRTWALEEMHALGLSARVEQNGGKHNNVVVGDPEKAAVLFTAHYDTPNVNFMPNLMLPRNPALFFLYTLAVVSVLLVISALVMLGVGAVTGNPQAASIAWIATYFGVLLLMNYGSFPNKHNANDNTSGVATLFTAMAQLAPEDRAKAAFILFDNEEKGLAGSKAYAKDHQQVAYTRLTVNLDCVGVGENILVISKKLATQQRAYAPFRKRMEAVATRKVHFFGERGSVSNTDWKNFRSSCTIMACRKAKVVGFYTPHIHTRRDTVADEGNISAIGDAIAEYISGLQM